jgi:hypothetical protein
VLEAAQGKAAAGWQVCCSNADPVVDVDALRAWGEVVAACGLAADKDQQGQPCLQCVSNVDSVVGVHVLKASDKVVAMCVSANTFGTCTRQKQAQTCKRHCQDLSAVLLLFLLKFISSWHLQQHIQVAEALDWSTSHRILASCSTMTLYSCKRMMSFA